MISVASEMSGQSPSPYGVSQLPVQVSYEFDYSSISVSVGSLSFSHATITSFCLTGSNSQVLTLQASNLTSEALTLTVLAPASFTSLPSVVSLNSSPSTPMSPFAGFSELTGRVSGDRRSSAMQRLSSAPLLSDNQKQNGDVGARSVSLNKQASPSSDVVPSTGLGCTHLWLQSRVPLGYASLLLLPPLPLSAPTKYIHTYMCVSV
jgi:hypothetical protein